jgi:hypothetical protein
MSSHTHDYERTFPYIGNKSFNQIEGPYSEG